VESKNTMEKGEWVWVAIGGMDYTVQKNDWEGTECNKLR